MIERIRKPGSRIASAGDRLFAAASFITALRERKIASRIAINGGVIKWGKVRKTLVDRRATSHDGYAASLRIRKRIGEALAAMTSGGIARLKVRGLARVQPACTLRIIAYNPA